MLLFCFEFNKCNLNPKAVQSNLDYPDLFPWSCFVMNINKMRSWKVETIKSTLILPNVCLKHCFNLFRFEKAWAAWDELLLWCIQLNSDGLILMLPRECHAWFCVSYGNTRPTNCKLTVMSTKRKWSVLLSKDKQTIFYVWRKEKKRQI